MANVKGQEPKLENEEEFALIEMKKVLLRQLTDQDDSETRNEPGMSFVFCEIKRAVLAPNPVWEKAESRNWKVEGPKWKIENRN